MSAAVMVPFPHVYPHFERAFWSVRCPVVTCLAAIGVHCREPDGTMLIGFYGPSTTNVHRARVTKFRLQQKYGAKESDDVQ